VENSRKYVQTGEKGGRCHNVVRPGAWLLLVGHAQKMTGRTDWAIANTVSRSNCLSTFIIPP